MKACIAISEFILILVLFCSIILLKGRLDYHSAVYSEVELSHRNELLKERAEAYSRGYRNGYAKGLSDMRAETEWARDLEHLEASNGKKGKNRQPAR